jgi:alkylation response protein AidB-like acyl-CoA dehydrogenase
MTEMGQMGFLGHTPPEAPGGEGMNYACYGLVAREVVRIGSSYGSRWGLDAVVLGLRRYGFKPVQSLEKNASGTTDLLSRLGDAKAYL